MAPTGTAPRAKFATVIDRRYKDGVRVASWNINSLRKREERLLLWLRETSPDVVCLQETKCTDDLFPVETLRDAGYAAVFHGQKSYNGVAILAKEEPRDVRMGFCDEVDDEQARIIEATSATCE